MPDIRTSAKAVIIEGGRILLIKRQSGRETWFGLPGGGQDKYEALEAALIRECLEETGYAVRVGAFMFVSEYIGKNHEFFGTDSGIHTVDLSFLCTIEKGKPPAGISIPDSDQVGIEWVEVARLPETPLYPKYLRRGIPEYLAGARKSAYLGDIN